MDTLTIYGIAGIAGILNIILESVKRNLPIDTKVKIISKSGILKQKIEPKVIENCSISNFFKFGEFNGVVEEFKDILEQEFSEYSLDAFYKNIKSLKIEQKDMTLYNKLKHFGGDSYTAGDYGLKKNKIRTDDTKDFNDTKATLFHELLHMATTRRNFKTLFCGLEISNNSSSIGTGLNEGYTELLCSHYFSKRRSYSYISLQQMALMIEDVVGEKLMKKAFFSNDMNAVINELAKYSSREKAIEIILKMDKLYGVKFKDLEKKKDLEEEIRCDIANIGINKSKKIFESGGMTDDSYSRILYSRLLESHGFMPLIYFDEDGNILKNRICFSFEPYSDYVDLSNEQYMMFANEFYQSNGDEPLNKERPFINRYGLNVEETFSKLRGESSAWYYMNSDIMDKFLLQPKRDTSIELAEMFSEERDLGEKVVDELAVMFDTDDTSNLSDRAVSLNKSFNVAVADSKTNSEPKLKAW